MKIRYLGAKRHHTWNIRGWISARKDFLGFAVLPGINYYFESESKQSLADRVVVVRTHKLTLSWLFFALAASHSSISVSDHYHLQAIERERFGLGPAAARKRKK